MDDEIKSWGARTLMKAKDIRASEAYDLAEKCHAKHGRDRFRDIISDINHKMMVVDMVRPCVGRFDDAKDMLDKAKSDIDHLIGTMI